MSVPGLPLHRKTWLAYRMARRSWERAWRMWGHQPPPGGIMISLTDLLLAAILAVLLIAAVPACGVGLS